MAKIHILDSETIDRIAAGEVVERPASVVKELVENSLDAGADVITVEVKEGGIDFIRVTDNGSGIERDQLRSAFIRHATSKIEDAADLNHLHSLGFRGEALSSIAAVSRVEVITKRKEDLTGTRISMDGANEREFSEVGAPDGTTFLMRNLFYNTPARRKFLKTPVTEGGYIAELMEHLALSRPDVSLKFMLNNKLRFHTNGNRDLKEVIYRIYGREIASSLVPIQTEENGIRIEGFLGKPVIVRSNRNFEITFINGRYIRSQVIGRAIEEGYKEYLMQHKFPLCILHITMAPEEVDVNVHPAKLDVRFADQIRFMTTLSQNIRTTLKNNEMIPDHVLDDENEIKKAEQLLRKENEREKVPEPFEIKRNSQYRVMEENAYGAELKTQDFLQKPVWETGKEEKKDEKNAFLSNDFFVEAKDDFFSEEWETPLQSSKQQQEQESQHQEHQEQQEQQLQQQELWQEQQLQQPQQEPQKQELQQPQQEQQPQHQQYQEPQPLQLNLFEERMISVPARSKYTIIGQVFETYWIVQYGGDKMFLIDQHAAHEKVKYERFMKRFREKEVLSQNLMPPVIVTLSGQEENVFRQYRDSFESLGFEIEEFGGNEYSLRSVPVDLYGCNEKELFLAVLDELCEVPSKGSFQVIEEKIASMSCKAAVKGGNRLSLPEINELIDELLTLENPYNCPHGRPTIITMTKYEMEKKFKRIVD